MAKAEPDSKPARSTKVAKKRCSWKVAVVATLLVLFVAAIIAAAHVASVLFSLASSPLDIAVGADTTVDMRGDSENRMPIAVRAELKTAAPSAAIGISLEDASCDFSVESRPLASVDLVDSFNFVALATDASHQDNRVLELSIHDVCPSTLVWLAASAGRAYANDGTQPTPLLASCDVTVNVNAFGLFTVPWWTSLDVVTSFDLRDAVPKQSGAYAIGALAAKPEELSRLSNTSETHSMDLLGMSTITVRVPSVGFAIGSPTPTHRASTAAFNLTCTSTAGCHTSNLDGKWFT